MIKIEKVQRNKTYILIFCDKSIELYNKYHWTVTECGKTFYLKRRIKTKPIYFHREVLNSQGITDHINGNGLDNRLVNLRVCTSQENNRNRKIKRIGTSRYKGVSYYKRGNKYEAYITINGQKKRIGYFLDETEAARAYDREAIKLFGNFAAINGV